MAPAPQEAEAGEQKGGAEAGKQTGESQTHGQRLRGDGADAELTDQAVGGRVPDLCSSTTVVSAFSVW